MNPQIVMNNDNPRARRSDPIESHMAADATMRQVKASQDIVERVLVESEEPLDDHAIEERAMQISALSPQRYRTAREELRELGAVRQFGSHRAMNPSGRLSTRRLWSHAKFNDHFEYCETCEVDHWWRALNSDPRYVELTGPCGTDRHLRVYLADE